MNCGSESPLHKTSIKCKRFGRSELKKEARQKEENVFSLTAAKDNAF